MGRLPERDTRQGATDSRIKWRPSNAAIAVVFILIFTVGPYLAFTQHLPLPRRAYTMKTSFANGVNLSTKSPVRIAGVDVGEVTDVGRAGNATEITFTVQDKGRPLHDDEMAPIRPRIVLAGK